MLNTKKTTTLTGNSVIDGKIAESYTANIDGNNPEDMNIYSSQVEKAVYKENRTQCRQDRAEFEEMAYSLQEEITKERKA